MKKCKLLLIIMIVAIIICGCSSNKSKDNKNKTNNEIKNTENINNDKTSEENNDIDTNQQNNAQQNETPDVTPSQNIKEPSNPITPSPVIPDDNYQTLTCSNYESDGDMSVTNSVIVKFRNNKVYNLNMSINTSIINEEIKERFEWKDFESQLEDAFSIYTPGKGVDITKQGNGVSYSYLIKINIDLDNVSKSKLDEMELGFLLDSTGNYEEIKINYGILGYTCG